MIKDNIGKGEIVIQYFPTGDMWSDINTKTLQGRLFYNIYGRLIGIGEGYDDDIDRLNTHPDLLPSQECADNVSAEETSVLEKAGYIVKVLRVAQNALPNATKKTQAAVEALLLNRIMARQTWELSSHCRSILGDKGKALCTGDKGTHTDGCRTNPRRLTDRQTGEKGTRTHELIHARGPKPCRLTDRHKGEKGTCTNGVIRAWTRQKYVLAAQ